MKFKTIILDLTNQTIACKMSNPALLLLLYKLGILFSGVFITYLGFRLFQKGIFNSSGDIDFSSNKKSFSIRNAAPGTFFCLLGAGIIITSLYQGFSIDSESQKNQPYRNQPVIEKPDLK